MIILPEGNKKQKGNWFGNEAKETKEARIKIVEAMKQRKMTIGQLAKSIGADQSCLWRILNEKTKSPTYELIARCMKELGIK